MWLWLCAPTHFILWKLLKTIPTSLCFTLCLHFLFFPGVRAAFFPVLRCVVSSRAKSSLGSSHMNIQYCRHNDKIITFHAIYYNAQLISIFYFVHYADYIRALCMLYVRCTQLTILFQTERCLFFSLFSSTFKHMTVQNSRVTTTIVPREREKNLSWTWNTQLMINSFLHEAYSDKTLCLLSSFPFSSKTKIVRFTSTHSHFRLFIVAQLPLFWFHCGNN